MNEWNIQKASTENDILIKDDKVVIIGNGFDMSVGIKSSYQDFIEYIKVKHQLSEDLELYEYNRLFLRKYENFYLNWSDFEGLYEQTIKKVNNRTQHAELQDSFEITSINDAIKKLEVDFYDYISEEYKRWIQQNTISQYDLEFKKFSRNINPFLKTLLEDEKAYFINFNYTNTLEDLCEDLFNNGADEERKLAKVRIKRTKERIAHIHGSIEKDNILFGGGFTDREDTKKLRYSQSLLNDKLFRIKENNDLSSTRRNIMNELDDKSKKSFDAYIIGHSLQGSDFTFLKTILNKANKVFIFYYEQDYTEKIEEIIREMDSSIVEKIVLIPFVEILFENDVIIHNFEEYTSIESCINNKFPQMDIFRNLSITAQHFLFKNITELRITAENIKVIMSLIKKLNKSHVFIKIKKLHFLDVLEEDIEELKTSKVFMEILSNVEKISFEKSEIDIDFLEALLYEGKNLTHTDLNSCTLLNNGKTELDISVCESLLKLEIKDCVFNPEHTRRPFMFHTNNRDTNIVKFTFEMNTNITIDNEVLEKSASLIELVLVLSDPFQVKAHLENLEILYIDCSKTDFPNITVGNKIKEIMIVGYPKEFLQFSSLMKNNENLLGFPNFRLLQLNSPDSITSFNDIDVDVLLDIFSKKIKITIDETSVSILDYYRDYKKDQNESFLVATKRIIEDTIPNFLDPKEEIVEEKFIEFKNWYIELSSLVGNSTNEESFISFVEKQLSVSHEFENEVLNKNNNSNILLDDTEKIQPNYSEIDILLFEYMNNKKSYEEIKNVLTTENKKTIVIEAYNSLINVLEQRQNLSIDDINKIRIDHFKNMETNIIEVFSNTWCVSSNELKYSAMQYESGMETIPNMGSIINSKKFETYRDQHPNAKPLKYSQEIKSAWQKKLNEEVVPLNSELKL